MADNTPQNNIPYVPENTLDPAAGLNLALNIIDALVQTSVISMALTAPPGSPAEGDRYIVKAPGSGAWTGHNNQLAMYETEGAFWNFYDARLILNEDDGGIFGFSDGAWAAAGGIPDAPSDGFQYVRINGAWARIAVPSGSVSSVNAIDPDTAGNVAIQALDIPFDPDTGSGLASDNVGAALNELGARPSGGGGSGTVTSVDVTLPTSLFAVTGGPVTVSGTIAGTLKTQVKNTVLAGPTTGADAAPTMRALVLADLPTLPAVPWVVEFAISDEITALTTGTAKLTTRAREAFSVVLVRASLSTASSSGLPTFDVKKNGTSIFSTKVSIDATEKTSKTAATAMVLTTSPTLFAEDDEITVDITTAGTGATGAKIALVGTIT